MTNKSIQTQSVPKLNDLLATAMAHYHVPGVAVGILHRGEEHYAHLGVTNVAHPLAVDSDTLFQIGSTTKTFTGTTAMRLVEMGKLDLDAPIRTYLPDLALKDEDVAARVTLRHVFTHTTGWLGDYFDDTGSGDDALAKIVARMVDLPQLAPLGAIWSYCNSGYYLAGRVIEVVTGKTYEAAVKELVLDPLGMDHSFFFPADVMTYRFASGHNVVGDEPVIARPWALARAAHAAGALCSSARDQLRYARFQMGDGAAPDGARLLAPESIAHMQTPRVAMDNMGGQIGVTWMVRDVGGVRTVAHGGATNGQLSAFLMVPQEGFAITVLTNANRGGELHREVVNWALKHTFGVSEPEDVPLALSDAETAPYLGRYTTALADTELARRDGALWLIVTPKGGFPNKDSKPAAPPPPPMRAVFCGPDRLMVLDEPMKGVKGEFLRNPDGAIAWFRFGGRIRERMTG
ncbi:MAG: beta-lactamase family protein [Chloroflexi bacterium]|nr:beta-lactamase family protein [Chloroflexota bacterium]